MKVVSPQILFSWFVELLMCWVDEWVLADIEIAMLFAVLLVVQLLVVQLPLVLPPC